MAHSRSSAMLLEVNGSSSLPWNETFFPPLLIPRGEPVVLFIVSNWWKRVQCLGWRAGLLNPNHRADPSPSSFHLFLMFRAVKFPVGTLGIFLAWLPTAHWKKPKLYIVGVNAFVLHMRRGFFPHPCPSWLALTLHWIVFISLLVGVITEVCQLIKGRCARRL